MRFLLGGGSHLLGQLLLVEPAGVDGLDHLGAAVELEPLDPAEVAGRPAVWIVGDDRRVALAPVTIERFSDGLIVLRDGVRSGQTVVGAGSHLLYPGRTVVDAADLAGDGE